MLRGIQSYPAKVMYSLRRLFELTRKVFVSFVVKPVLGLKPT